MRIRISGSWLAQVVQANCRSARLRPDPSPVPRSNEGPGQTETCPPATRSWRGVQARRAGIYPLPNAPLLSPRSPGNAMSRTKVRGLAAAAAMRGPHGSIALPCPKTTCLKSLPPNPAKLIICVMGTAPNAPIYINIYFNPIAGFLKASRN